MNNFCKSLYELTRQLHSIYSTENLPPSPSRPPPIPTPPPPSPQCGLGKHFIGLNGQKSYRKYRTVMHAVSLTAEIYAASLTAAV